MQDPQPSHPALGSRLSALGSLPLLSKLKETIICLRAGRVTLPYPAQPSAVPQTFRGRPVFDSAKCIGCAGCANNCPAREILVVDLCQEIRVLQYLGRRCTYCGRCADVCPEKAITMSHDFETATNRIGDLGQRLELFMSTCQRCGRCFKHPSPLEELKLKGYRFDDVQSERWIPRSQSYLQNPPNPPATGSSVSTLSPPVDDIPIELD